ncbi:MAG: hypothetical protein IKM61_06025 [Eubacteriaceae bacterium]|nr:hypothetical protein [Eubacteriaceae bacterium]
MAEIKKNIFDGVFEKVKDFTEDAMKKTSEIVSDLGDKIDDGIEAAKDKVQIEKIEYAINKKLRELGTAYYKNAKAGEATDLDAIVAEIDALYAEIEKVKSDDCEACGEDKDECCCETVEAEVVETPEVTE